jgi:tRNA A-37 threonylcarbamoyl transferase component Bud32
MTSTVPSTDHDDRVRSPADLLRFVIATCCLLLLLLAEWLFGEMLVGFGSEFLAGLAAVPEWLLAVFVAATRVIAMAVLIFGLVRAVIRHGWHALSTMLVAAAVALLLLWLLHDVADADAGDLVVPELEIGPLGSDWFPTVGGIAVLTALLTASAPWLARRWRRLGSVAVAGLMVARLLYSAVSFDSLRAVVIGWVAGCATLVLLGAPQRRPTAGSIAEGLSHVGLPVAAIRPANVDARGSTPYFATDTDGGGLFVKALGRDERSADLLFRVYRRVQRHELGDERPFSSLRRAVEHEAFVALAARDLGVQTPRLRAVAAADPSAMVLAYDAVDGRSLDRVAPDQLTDAVLQDVWAQMALLREHRIAHRDLRLANLFLGAEGTVWLIDFGFSEMAASDLLLATDVAELVTSSAVVVGAPRATGPAVATVDAATRLRATERLRPWALSGATRTAVKAHPGLLEELRERLGAS